MKVKSEKKERKEKKEKKAKKSKKEKYLKKSNANDVIVEVDVNESNVAIEIVQKQENKTKPKVNANKRRAAFIRARKVRNQESHCSILMSLFF